MDIYSTKFEDFKVSGSKFYREWEAFKEFREKERQKAIDLKGAGDKAYREAIVEYNRKHKDEEGCIMYQYMWMANDYYNGKSMVDMSIADGILDGPFKNYINWRRTQVRDNEERYKNQVEIWITKDERLLLRQKGESVYKSINPKELMELLSKYKFDPTNITITSEKELPHLEKVVKEACRKNNLLKIGYQVMK
jgi:hypothetical protein